MTTLNPGSVESEAVVSSATLTLGAISISPGSVSSEERVAAFDSSDGGTPTVQSNSAWLKDNLTWEGEKILDVTSKQWLYDWIDKTKHRIDEGFVSLGDKRALRWIRRETFGADVLDFWFTWYHGWIQKPPPVLVVAGILNPGIPDRGIRVTTVTPHTLSNWDVIYIEGVLGATQANGHWEVIVVDSVTVDLWKSGPPSTYTSGGVIRISKNKYAAMPSDILLNGTPFLSLDAPSTPPNHIQYGMSFQDRKRLRWTSTGSPPTWVAEDVTHAPAIQGQHPPFFRAAPIPPWLDATLANRQAVFDARKAAMLSHSQRQHLHMTGWVAGDTPKTGPRGAFGHDNNLADDIYADLGDLTDSGTTREQMLYDICKKYWHRPCHFIESDGTLLDYDKPQYSGLRLSSGGIDKRCSGYKTLGQWWHTAWTGVAGPDSVSGEALKPDGGALGSHLDWETAFAYFFRHRDPGTFQLILEKTKILGGICPDGDRGLGYQVGNKVQSGRTNGRVLISHALCWWATGEERLLTRASHWIKVFKAYHDSNVGVGCPAGTLPSPPSSGAIYSCWMAAIWVVGLQVIQHVPPISSSDKTDCDTIMKALLKWMLECWAIEEPWHATEYRMGYWLNRDGTLYAGSSRGTVNWKITAPVFDLVNQRGWRGDFSAPQLAKLDEILEHLDLTTDPHGHGRRVIANPLLKWSDTYKNDNWLQKWIFDVEDPPQPRDHYAKTDGALLLEQTLYPGPVASENNVGSPTLTLDATSISPDSVTNENNVGAPVVGLGGSIVLSPGSVTSENRVGYLTLRGASTSLFARQEFEADGVTTVFTLPFSYLDADHITVESLIGDGVPLPSYTLSGTTLTFATPPSSWVSFLVRRLTPGTNPLVEFSGSARVSPTDLNRAFLQLLYRSQEISDEQVAGW